MSDINPGMFPMSPADVGELENLARRAGSLQVPDARSVQDEALQRISNHLLPILVGAAQRAIAIIRTGKGGAYGSRVHAEFRRQVDALGLGLGTEINYLGGLPISYNALGSVRLDVALFDNASGGLVLVFDLKVNSARLSRRQILKIRRVTGRDVPVLEVPITSE